MARDPSSTQAATTYSHARETPFALRLRHLAGLFASNLRTRRNGREEAVAAAGRRIDALLTKIARARGAVGQANADDISTAHVLEIGHGQRCVDGLVLHSLGARYTGIDADVATYRLSLTGTLRILRRNGAFRLAKSAARHLLFDRPYYAALDTALRARGARLDAGCLDLRVASADEISTWTETFDVIFSTDVFEHLEPAILRRTVSAMADRLTERGCCVITVNHFSGITGGHTPEWSAAHLGETRHRRTPPWNHLRFSGQTGDTYLNGLHRRDYLALFAGAWTIVGDSPDDDAGQPYLTPAVAAEFPAFSAAELCATSWTYVLSRR